MNAIFDACVKILYVMAGCTGLTYKQINVIIFCMVWPVITVLLMVVVAYQHGKIKKLTSRR